MPNVDDQIRESLSRLGDDGREVPAWASFVQRRRRRRVQRAIVGAAAVVLVVAGAVVGAGALQNRDTEATDIATAPGNDDHAQNPPDSQAEENEGEESDGERGVDDVAAALDVAVAAEDLEPLEIETTALVRSERGWLEHSVVVVNTGSSTVHVNDPRGADVLGDREVLVATEGCGYGSAGGGDVSPACRLDYQPLTIEPGEEVTLDVTLWRDLEGLNPPTGGPYAWRRQISTAEHSFSHPEERGDVGTLVITYDLDGGAEAARSVWSHD